MMHALPRDGRNDSLANTKTRTSIQAMSLVKENKNSLFITSRSSRLNHWCLWSFLNQA